MCSKVLVGEALATKLWWGLVKKFLAPLLFFITVLLYIPAGVIWFVSLGHVDFIGVVGDCCDVLFDEFGGAKK